MKQPNTRNSRSDSWRMFISIQGGYEQ